LSSPLICPCICSSCLWRMNARTGQVLRRRARSHPPP
jgi:hypothetical protein